MRSGSHRGAIFGQGGVQVGKKGPGIGLNIARMAPFWNPKSIKIMNVRHLFLDVFLDCIFDGFERLLDLILVGFGRPNGA